MKEKAADVEDHRTKVELEQHPNIKTTATNAPTSSAPTGKSFISPANPTGPTSNSTIGQQQPFKQSNKESTTGGTSSKTTLLSPSSNNNNNNSSNANNNFDDDYNEWDISIGNLIIDLDADIERQSEGDKPNRNTVAEASNQENNKNSNRKKVDSSPNQTKTAVPAGMSSNFKLSRLGTLASSGSATSAASAGNTTSSPAITGSTNGGNGSSGSSGGHLNRHSSSHVNNPNPKNNYAVSSLNVASSASSNSSSSSSASSSSSTPPTKSLNSSSIELHAKSLKMKIKRKSIGGKISEVNHEIVSSDASPQACTKTYISSLDHHNSNSSATTAPTATSAAVTTTANQSVTANNGVATNSSSTIQHISNSNSTCLDNSQNSVINATDPEEIATPAIDSATALSKSAKHSAKNKNGHRDKKEKNRIEKEKINYPTNSVTTSATATVAPVAVGSTVNESDDLVSSTLNAPPASVTLKYPNSTVINQMKPEELKKPRIEKVDDHIADRAEMGTMTSIATITEPDCLGPCEPGTSVTLEGIVWQETENGVLVVNVTWRGKTYVGTLLDCTKHDWAPPRFCESPTSDIESKSLKNTRGKRARNSFIAENSIDTRSVTSKLRNGKGRRTANSGYVPTSPAGKNDPANVNKRKGRPTDLELNFSEEAGKRNKMSKLDGCDVQPNSPVLIECPEPNCSKKYRHINGLKYHQSHAHFGSSFNVSDTQEFEPASEILNSNKGDASDSEYNDSLNMLDSPLKTIDKSLNEAIVKKQASSTNEICGPNAQPESVTPNSASLSTESKKLVKSGANEPSIAEGHKNQPDKSLLSHAKSDIDVKEKLEVKESIISDKVDKSDVLDTEVNTTNTVEQSRSQSGPSKSSNEMENMPSPAYSDISDDNSSSNDNSANAVPPNQTLDKAVNDPFMDAKKMPNNFNISALPHYFNKSQYLMPPNKAADSKPKDLKLPESNEMSIDNIPEQSRAQGLYAPYPSLYRFGSSPSSKNAPAVTSMEPSPPVGKSEAETKDPSNLKSEFGTNNSNNPNPNANKQPIVELQNLKNRIQYTFDQNSVHGYEMQKPKYPEGDKSKDRSKYSPQMKKPKEKDEKDKGKHDEGIKPTMETTGPPTLTNGYYYNPSFLPASFPPFDAMFRGNPMNPAVMGPPYGPSGPSSFLHSQMRFPHLGPLDGLPPMPGSSVSRTTTAPTPHSSTTSSVKTSHSYNHNPNKMLSPTTSSPCVPSSSHSALSLSASSTGPSHKPSPSKEFPSPGPNSHGGIPGHGDQPPRPATSSNSSLHSNSRHPPLHTSHIGYPIFDPYSAMIVNHSVQANAAVHQFAPK